MAKNLKPILPKVTVLMPVYNGEKYLREAINSILNQTFTDFEFLIIDDGSKDKTEGIIRSYTDPRIRLLTNKKNQGVVHSLNKGIESAKGKYIARMDADDLSMPERLNDEVNFLEKNPDHSLVGTMRYTMNDKRQIKSLAFAVFDNEDIQLYLAFGNIFTHGSVMIRKSVLLDNDLRYNLKAKHFEDFDLWIKIANISKVANLSKPLYSWMHNPQGISSVNNQEMNRGSDFLTSQQLKTVKLPKLSIYKIRNYWVQSHYKVRGKIQPVFSKEYQYFLLRFAFLSLKKRHFPNFIILLLLTVCIQPLAFMHSFHTSLISRFNKYFQIV